MRWVRNSLECLGQRFASRRCLLGAREIPNTFNLCSPIRIKENFFSDLMITRILKHGKQILTCNGIRAYYMGQHDLPEDVQSRSKYSMQWSAPPNPLPFYVLRTFDQ
jgi:hypothetical protein